MNFSMKIIATTYRPKILFLAFNSKWIREKIRGLTRNLWDVASFQLLTMVYRKTPQTCPRTILTRNFFPLICSRELAAKASWKKFTKEGLHKVKKSFLKILFLIFGLWSPFREIFTRFFCSWFPGSSLQKNVLGIYGPEAC